MPLPVVDLLRNLSSVAWAAAVAAAFLTTALWTALLAVALRGSPRM